MEKMIWIVIVSALAFGLWDTILHPRRPLRLSVYFGVPGAGKSTYAAYLVRAARSQSVVIRLCKYFYIRRGNQFCKWILNHADWFKRPVKIWSNVEVSGAYQLDARNDIGKYHIADGTLIIDEAGIEFNNRNYKSFPQDAIKFFKLHRHYGVDVHVFSQSFEDMDITIRRLAQQFFLIKRSLIPGFIVVKKIYKRVGIDANTHQLVDCYSFGLPLLDTQWIYSPPLWKLFNSYSVDSLPEKHWTRWSQRQNQKENL